MSIVGVGVDIESIERFEGKDALERLVARVFTTDEAAYCHSRARPASHLAARFAAKEAAVKALNSVLPDLLVTQVEIYKDEASPAPRLRLIGGATLPSGLSMHVSLSHSESSAAAFVVVERLCDSPGGEP